MQGARPGERRGGRTAGIPNKRTVEREQAMAEAAAKAALALGPAAFQGDAHALLMLTYKDTLAPLDVRLDAAKAAIGYEKPRLQAIDAKVDVDATMHLPADVVTERVEKLAQASLPKAG